MPYIERSRRDALLDETTCGVGEAVEGPGELNFVLTHVCLDYLGFCDGESWASWSYAELNEVIGVLECAKQELYRRVVAPYEDGKAKINGDVYPRDKQEG